MQGRLIYTKEFGWVFRVLKDDKSYQDYKFKIADLKKSSHNIDLVDDTENDSYYVGESNLILGRRGNRL